jgi:hypothetical protein
VGEQLKMDEPNRNQPEQLYIHIGLVVAILVLFALVAEQASRLSSLTRAVENVAEHTVETYRVME